jgi:hypothetical protein
MPIALLICMENTFWSRKGSNFGELFKKSFKLYVESGTRDKVEAAINILINEEGHGGCLETEDFKAKFYMIISEHFLCKIHIFYFALNTSNHFHRNTAHPEEKGKKVTFMQRLKLKIR